MDINMTLLGQSIAMLVFVWFCMKFIWPPIMQAIEERQTQIADGLAAAERGQQSLDKAKAESEDIVGDARKQATTILDQAHARANEIVAEGKADGVKERERQLVAAKAESSRKPIGHAKNCVARFRLLPLPVPKRFCNAKSTARPTKTFWASWRLSFRTNPTWQTTTQLHDPYAQPLLSWQVKARSGGMVDSAGDSRGVAGGRPGYRLFGKPGVEPTSSG